MTAAPASRPVDRRWRAGLRAPAARRARRGRRDHRRDQCTPRTLPQPARLLIATARAAHALRIERTLTPSPNRATWMAFVSGDSKTQRNALQKAGFDFLIREPVHPTALRVLFQRALFRGSNTRRAQRVACGHPVRYRTGFWPRNGTLIDLSPRGCRLLVDKAIAEKAELRITIPSGARRRQGAAPARARRPRLARESRGRRRRRVLGRRALRRARRQDQDAPARRCSPSA